MNLTTVTSRAAAALVAAVAGYASYNHIVSVATAAGEHRGVALVLPLSIDGLIVVGTMAMLEDKRARRVPRPMARVALAFGIVATIAANVASAEPTATARMVAAIPALAFLIAVEVLAHTGKPRTPEPATMPANSTPPRPAKRTPVKAAKTRQSNAERVANAVATKPGMTQAQIADLLGLGERTVQRHWPKPAATVNGHHHGEG